MQIANTTARPSSINSNRLAHCATVVETGSFTRVAERLGISKAVVSQQVARLEQEARVTLLLRTTRKVVAPRTTLPDPKAFENAMIAGDFGGAFKLAANWPYAGYRLTVFSSTEELLAAPQLQGHPKYYVSDALSQAGAHVDHMQQGAVNVVVDRELVTAQQPFSSDAFAEAFVEKLSAPHPTKR